MKHLWMHNRSQFEVVVLNDETPTVALNQVVSVVPEVATGVALVGNTYKKICIETPMKT